MRLTMMMSVTLAACVVATTVNVAVFVANGSSFNLIAAVVSGVVTIYNAWTMIGAVR